MRRRNRRRLRHRSSGYFPFLLLLPALLLARSSTGESAVSCCYRRWPGPRFPDARPTRVARPIRLPQPTGLSTLGSAHPAHPIQLAAYPARPARPCFLLLVGATNSSDLSNRLLEFRFVSLKPCCRASSLSQCTAHTRRVAYTQYSSQDSQPSALESCTKEGPTCASRVVVQYRRKMKKLLRIN